jgi:predicted permease
MTSKTRPVLLEGVMWSDTWRDVRLAARTLQGSPLFTLTAVLSLAIGIGGTAVIFGVADTYLLQPWPGIAHPEKLVEIGRIDMDGPGPPTGDGFNTFSYPNYADYLQRQTVFQGLAASRIGDAVGIGDGTRAVRVAGEYVTTNYFSVLGTRIARGRDFVADDLQLSVPASVAIISDRLWRSQFGRDANIVGRTVQLNGRPFTIVGVLAAGFNGSTVLDTSIWMPLTAFPDGDLQRFGRRGQQWLMGIGRLKDDVTAAQARAEMSRIARQLAAEYPDDNRRHGLGVEPAAGLPVDGRSPISRFIALVGALTGLVLLIACSNVGGMVLARGVNRAREMSLRLALGAERVRLVRLLMAESVVIALTGAALGLLLASWGLTLLGRLVPMFAGTQLTYDVQVDWRVTAFSIGIAALTVMACGLIPALQSTRVDLATAIKPANGGGPKRLRARHVLLAAQVAFSMLLVVTALLLGRSLTNANAIDPGFTLDGVDVADFDLRLGQPGSPRAFFDELMARVQQLPGLESAALARVVPLTREREGGRVWRLGEQGDERAMTVSRNFVSPDYFRVLRIPLVSGRVFDERDRAGAQPVAVVNETMARQAWPGQDPIGQFLQGRTGRPLLVVGLVPDTKYRTIGEEPTPFVYISAAQTNEAIMRLLMRPTGASLIPQVRAIVAEMNPNLPMEASTLSSLTSIVLLPHRLASWLAGVVAIIGAFLAALGIYGLVAYNVAQRRREIGVRVALGALRVQVMRLILAASARAVVVGAAIGLLASSLLTDLLAGMLYGVDPLDPLSFMGGAVLLMIVAALASLVPARRAASVNPVEALRAE